MTKTDAMSIIVAAFGSLAGKRVLDAGCGRGVLARSLADRGARVCGLDPNTEALSAVRRAVPEGTFHPSGAEAMLFADDSFDGVIFLNSLHHVQRVAMPQALREAARVARPESPVVVIEPLAEGPLFSVLKTVEDETAVRAAAQDAIDEAIEDGSFKQLRRTDYLRRERFTELEHFVSHAAGVDPARAAVLEERRTEVEAAFQRQASVAADGRMVLEQPMRARVLVARA